MPDDVPARDHPRSLIVRVIFWTCCLLAGAVIYGTVCPLIRTKLWWIRIMDFPRIQLFVLGVLAIVGLWFTRPPPRRRAWWSLVFLLVLGLVLQGIRIHPFTPLASYELPPASEAEVDSSRKLDLLVANVEFDNTDATPLLSLIEATTPDVIFLVETDAAWLERLTPLEAAYPYNLLDARPEGRGLALYSRLPLEDAEVRAIVTPSRPSVRADVLLPSGERVAFWGLHPAPPGLEEDDGDRKSSAPRDAELIQVANEIAARAGRTPCVVAGDFNDAAWSHTTREFKRISGMLDPRIGRGLFNTYHAERPFLRYPIDHIFVTPEFALVRLERSPFIGSDHFPMRMVVVLESD